MTVRILGNSAITRPDESDNNPVPGGAAGPPKDFPRIAGSAVPDEMVAALANAIPHIVWSTDARGAFDYANHRWEEYTHQVPGAADEAAWLALLHSDDRDRIASTWQTSVDSGEPFECEFRLRRWDGVYRWHLSRGEAVRDADGRIVRWFGTCTDIDDLKGMEQRFLQAQKMEAVGRLAGGVAHDFNNLLTVIKGHSEFLSLALPPEGQAREDIDQIARAANRAADLTRQLLAFSRQQVLEKRVIDSNALLRELEKMLSRLIGEDINLQVSLDTNAPLVLADAGQVEHAIMNLVVNARDAMPNGGDLTLSTRPVSVSPEAALRHEARPGEYLAIGVGDTGGGIDPELLVKIFEPFFTTKDAGRGTGLGLATVYGIARQSGGFVEVSSIPGKGSTFTFYLPAAPTDAHGGNRVVTGSVRGDELVLLVEDQDDVRAVARRILTTHGYRVLEARNGVDALALLTDLEPGVDLVLTDAVMPQMSGPDLVRALRSKQPRLPVVIASGYADHELMSYGAAELNVPFLHKPFRAEDLLRAVRKALDEVMPLR